MLQKLLRHRYSVLLLLVGLALGAWGAVSYARQLRGDIDIAGGPAYSPSPVRRPPIDVPFAYDCRLQLNDFGEGRERKIVYQGKEHPYDLYAYADISLANQINPGITTDSLHWNWIAAIVNEEAGTEEDPVIEIPLAGPPADAFSTKGHAISVSSDQEEGKAPEFRASGLVKLPVGNYFLVKSGLARGGAGETLRFNVIASIPRSSGPNPGAEPDQLWRRLYVECVPVKR